MNPLNNYGLLLEKKAYVVEPADLINEAALPDMQSTKGLNLVLSGENDKNPDYTNQWNQLVDHMTDNKKKDGTYTATVKHDWGAPMVNIQYKVVGGKIDWNSLTAPGATQTGGKPGESLDLNKLAEYDPKGKHNEFVAALMTVAVEKFGQAWTKQHIDWVNSQINKCKALGGFYSGIERYSTASYLVNDGNIFDLWINKLSGGDRISQIDTIKKTSVIAGSAASDSQIKVILDAIDLKMNETITSEIDANAIHGLYMLISPKYSGAAIARLWSASGKASTPLSTIAKEASDMTLAFNRAFGRWCVGVRGATYPETFYATYGFDKNSYAASLAAIKKSLV